MSDAPSRIRPIGWYMRNLAPDEAPAHRRFWREQLGLPLIREVGPAMDVLWGGETQLVELAYGNPAAPVPPARQGYVPVFLAHGLDALAQRLGERGLEAAPAAAAAGREIALRDPQGHAVLLREPAPGGDPVQARELARRTARGEAYNPGCRRMPEGIQELAWIRRRAADPAAIAGFYADVLGCARRGRQGEAELIDLGDGVVMEVVAGGSAAPPPHDRKACDALIILRVDGIAAFRERLAAHGVHVINPRIETYWGELTYFADPEGQVIGVECAQHPGEYSPGKLALPEGLEAERRWREALAARSAAG